MMTTTTLQKNKRKKSQKMSKTFKRKDGKEYKIVGDGSKKNPFDIEENTIENYLETKLDKAGSHYCWNWIINVNDITLNQDDTLDEITMQGEFGEEMDIVKEWIEEWKETENEK